MRLLMTLLAMPVLFAANPELLKVKSVYLLPMGSGLDQYLANQLLKSGTYVVVTDPANADAVFTDTIGPALEHKLAELYPVAKVAKEDEEEEEEKVKTEEPAKLTFRRGGRGMVFLIERKSRQVVWSTFELPRDSRPGSLDKSAQKIVDQLKKDLGPKIQ
jgi:hypothetical protein